MLGSKNVGSTNFGGPKVLGLKRMWVKNVGEGEGANPPHEVEHSEMSGEQSEQVFCKSYLLQVQFQVMVSLVDREFKYFQEYEEFLKKN